MEDYHAYTFMKKYFFTAYNKTQLCSSSKREFLSLTMVRCSKVSECQERSIKFVSIYRKVFCYLHHLKQLLNS